eukprot:PhM_4_TR15690/c2_g5_i1/m.54430
MNTEPESSTPHLFPSTNHHHHHPHNQSSNDNDNNNNNFSSNAQHYKSSNHSDGMDDVPDISKSCRTMLFWRALCQRVWYYCVIEGGPGIAWLVLSVYIGLTEFQLDDNNKDDDDDDVLESVSLMLNYRHHINSKNYNSSSMVAFNDRSDQMRLVTLLTTTSQIIFFLMMLVLCRLLKQQQQIQHHSSSSLSQMAGSPTLLLNNNNNNGSSAFPSLPRFDSVTWSEGQVSTSFISASPSLTFTSPASKWSRQLSLVIAATALLWQYAFLFTFVAFTPSALILGFGITVVMVCTQPLIYLPLFLLKKQSSPLQIYRVLFPMCCMLSFGVLCLGISTSATTTSKEGIIAVLLRVIAASGDDYYNFLVIHTLITVAAITQAAVLSYKLTHVALIAHSIHILNNNNVLLSSIGNLSSHPSPAAVLLDRHSTSSTSSAQGGFASGTAPVSPLDAPPPPPPRATTTTSTTTGFSSPMEVDVSGAIDEESTASSVMSNQPSPSGSHNHHLHHVHYPHNSNSSAVGSARHVMMLMTNSSVATTPTGSTTGTHAASSIISLFAPVDSERENGGPTLSVSSTTRRGSENALNSRPSRVLARFSIAEGDPSNEEQQQQQQSSDQQQQQQIQRNNNSNNVSTTTANTTTTTTLSSTRLPPDMLTMHSTATPVSSAESNSTSSSALQKQASVSISWQRGRLLGEGACGKVYLALNNDTTQLMAVKTVQFDTSDPDLKLKLTALQTEIKILKKLSHPCIVKYLSSEKAKEGTGVNIFLEYVPGGSLSSLIQNFGALQENTVVQFTHQILRGLAYLHRNAICHGDVKGGNILVSSEGYVKLTDFGSSIIMEEGHSRKMVGTPMWMAPEVVRGEEITEASDIWSLGCTVLEMITGRHPWAHMGSPIQILNYLGDDSQDISLPTEVDLSSQLKALLKACFQRQPWCRPTAEDLLQYSFFYWPEEDDAGNSTSLSDKDMKLMASMTTSLRQQPLLRSVRTQAASGSASVSVRSKSLAAAPGDPEVSFRPATTPSLSSSPAVMMTCSSPQPPLRSAPKVKIIVDDDDEVMENEKEKEKEEYVHGDVDSEHGSSSCSSSVARAGNGVVDVLPQQVHEYLRRRVLQPTGIQEQE